MSAPPIDGEFPLPLTLAAFEGKQHFVNASCAAIYQPLLCNAGIPHRIKRPCR
jgi:hypothetical protein